MTKTLTNEKECKWESGELGNSEENAVLVSAEEGKAIDDSLDLQMISIRLPKGLIEELKFLANREGLGYQPLIRRLLLRYVEGEMKAIAMEQQYLARKAMESTRKTRATTEGLVETPTPKKKVAAS